MALRRRGGKLDDFQTTAAQSTRDKQIFAYLFVAACSGALVVCYFMRLHQASVAILALGVGALGFADLRGLMVLAQPVFALLGASVGLSIAEGGAYIGEQHRFGENIGATPLFSLYALAFVGTAHLGMSIVAARSPNQYTPISRKRIVRLTDGIALAVVSVYLILFVLYGTPLAFGNRFDWVNSLPPALRSVRWISHVVLGVLYTLTGLYVRLYGNSWRSPRSLIPIFPLLVVFSTGEKFSMFITAGCMFLTGVGLGGFLLGRRSKVGLRPVVGVSLSAVLLWLTVSFGYARSGSSNTSASIAQRLPLQGHVWYGIFDRFGGVPSVQFIQLVRPNTLSSPSGLDLLSYYVADPDFVRQRISQGMSFTMGGPPSALAAFGSILGLVAFTCAGLMYVVVVWMAVSCLRHGRLVATCGVIVLYTVVSGAVLMGVWNGLYGPIAIATYAGIAVFWLGKRSSPRLDRQMRPTSPTVDSLR